MGYRDSSWGLEVLRSRASGIEDYDPAEQHVPAGGRQLELPAGVGPGLAAGPRNPEPQTLKSPPTISIVVRFFGDSSLW